MISRLASMWPGISNDAGDAGGDGGLGGKADANRVLEPAGHRREDAA